MAKDKSDISQKPNNIPVPNKKEKKCSVQASVPALSITLIIAAGVLATTVYYERMILPENKPLPLKTQTEIPTHIPVVSPTPKATPTEKQAKKKTSTARPQEPVTEIKYVIPESISNAINRLYDKVGKMENLTNQYMNIKADSSAVISMGERLDELEKRTTKLAQISNDGALILTAAIMIKENAATGQSVRFEAEILKQLAAAQPEIENQINYIYNNSSHQYPSDKNLISEFNQISDHIISDFNHRGNWKDRLLRKIKEYIRISGTESEDREIKELKKIGKFVNEKQFAIAVEILSQVENKPLLADKKLARWYATTDSKLKFNRALSDISIYSLALMKTEKLKTISLP